MPKRPPRSLQQPLATRPVVSRAERERREYEGRRRHELAEELEKVGGQVAARIARAGMIPLTLYVDPAIHSDKEILHRVREAHRLGRGCVVIESAPEDCGLNGTLAWGRGGDEDSVYREEQDA